MSYEKQIIQFNDFLKYFSQIDEKYYTAQLHGYSTSQNLINLYDDERDFQEEFQESKFFYSELKDASTISLALDGNVYTFTEDPGDGYRSTASDVLVNYLPCSYEYLTIIPPIDVIFYYENNREQDLYTFFHDSRYGGIIQLIEIGTDYSDSWYPSFVTYINQQNMSIALRHMYNG